MQPSTWITEGRRNALQEKLPENDSSVASDGIRTLQRMENLVNDIENARKTVAKDDTITKSGRDVKVAEYANKKEREMFKLASEAEENVRAAIRSIDDKINTEIQQSGKSWHLSGEAMQHVKSLEGEGERISFMRQAIKNGDDKTVQAVLHGRGYMSGLSADAQQSLLQQYKETKFSSELATQKAYGKVAEAIGRGYQAESAKISEMETAAVQSAKNRQAAAQKALSQ